MMLEEMQVNTTWRLESVLFGPSDNVVRISEGLQLASGSVAKPGAPVIIGAR